MKQGAFVAGKLVDEKLEAKNKTFADSLKSDEFERTPEHQKVVDKFYADIKKTGLIPAKVKAVFGPDIMPENLSNDGYLEEYITPTWGGSFVKIYGCSYHLKFPWMIGRAEGIELMKSLLSEVPRDIIAKGNVYVLAVLFRFLFQRKKFWRDILQLVWAIEWRSLRHYDLKPNEWNVYSRELNRSANYAIHKEFGIDFNTSHSPAMIKQLNESDLGYLLLKLKRIGLLIIESDPCYRFPLQDVLGSGERDVFNLIDLLISRTTREGMAVRRKWVFIKLILRVLFFLEPRLRRVAKEFMAELNPEKLKMDEADIYFSLLYQNYNFGGRSYEEREAEWRWLNKEHCHSFLL